MALGLMVDNTGFIPIEKCSSVEQLKASLRVLKERESAVTTKLNNLVSSQTQFARELGRLDLLRGQISAQTLATRAISNDVLVDAATTAGSLSDAVQRLDMEQARVKATLQVVEQVSELKACVLGVTGSMGAPQDWETAAGYLQRALKIPKDVIEGAFAESTVPSGEVPDLPKVTLHNAAKSLCVLFVKEFEKAAQENNGAKVTRFFKLFPLIGRSDVGLDIYGRYVCQGVAANARANIGVGTNRSGSGMVYAQALTKLFEFIAQIIERHGGLVEQHYGQGKMVKVIERLQFEADSQGGIILDTWSDEKNLDRKLTDIKSYAFTFLVQSFLMSKSTDRRSDSPAPATDSPRQSLDEEGGDMKEVDSFLSEMSLMLSRWSLYCRFVANKCIISISDQESLHIPEVLTDSILSKKIASRVSAPFVQMSTFYFRRSVEKAFQLDDMPKDLSLKPGKSFASNPPFITSAVDDVMFIVDKLVSQALATSQRTVVTGVVPTIGRILGADFIGMIQRKMRDEHYPKAAAQGLLPPESTVIAFIVLINNLDISTEYLHRIVSSRLAVQNLPNGVNGGTHIPDAMSEQYPFEDDAAVVTNTLKALESNFTGKVNDLLGDGITVLNKNVMRPRLRPILADTFRDIEYSLTEDELEEITRIADENNEQNLAGEETIQIRFQAGWDLLVKPIVRIMTPGAYDKLLTALVTYLAEVLEKRIWSYQGRMNELGAIRLERDVASIVSIVVKGARYSLRENFVRCTQICLIMNMEEDEFAELTASVDAGLESEWKLNADDRARAFSMVKSR